MKIDINETKNLLRNTLRDQAFFLLNKAILKTFGIEPALLLSDLLSKEMFFELRGQLEDGWFYNLQDNIEEDTTLSPHLQRKAYAILEENNVIKIKKKGVPAKNYYKINHEEILLVLKNFDNQSLKSLTTRGQKNKELIRNKNKSNKNTINNISETKEFHLNNSLPIIEKWNSLSRKYSIHKHKVAGSKRCKSIEKYITLLKNGNMSGYVDLKQTFIDRNAISQKLLAKKWTDLEIKKIIHSYGKMFVEGYWPQDKSKLPKDLDQFIYNSITGTSFFFLVAAKKPERLEEAIVPENIHPEIAKKYLKLFTGAGKADKNKIIRSVNAIMEIHAEIVHRLYSLNKHNKFGSYIVPKDQFINMHIKWLDDHFNKYLRPEHITNAGSWNKFADFVKQTHGIILYPTPKEMEKIKQEAHEAEERIRRRG